MKRGLLAPIAALLVALIIGAIALQLGSRRAASAAFAELIEPYGGAFASIRPQGPIGGLQGRWVVLDLRLDRPPEPLLSVAVERLEVAGAAARASTRPGAAERDMMRVANAVSASGLSVAFNDGRTLEAGRAAVTDLYLSTKLSDAVAAGDSLSLSAAAVLNALSVGRMTARGLRADLGESGATWSAEQLSIDDYRRGFMGRASLKNARIARGGPDGLEVTIASGGVRRLDLRAAASAGSGPGRAESRDPRRAPSLTLAGVDARLHGGSRLEVERARLVAGNEWPGLSAPLPSETEISGAVFYPRIDAQSDLASLAAVLGERAPFDYRDRWRVADGFIEVSDARLDAPDLFALDFGFTIAPPDMPGPAFWAAGALGARLAAADWRYEDKSFFDAVLDAAARERGRDLETTREEIVTALGAFESALEAGGAGRIAVAEARQFVSEPAALRVSVAPKTPVHLADLGFAFLAGVDTAAEEFGVALKWEAATP